MGVQVHWSPLFLLASRPSLHLNYSSQRLHWHGQTSLASSSRWPALFSSYWVAQPTLLPRLSLILPAYLTEQLSQCSWHLQLLHCFAVLCFSSLLSFSASAWWMSLVGSLSLFSSSAPRWKKRMTWLIYFHIDGFISNYCYVYDVTTPWLRHTLFNHLSTLALGLIVFYVHL